jgi:hypothetical protein
MARRTQPYTRVLQGARKDEARTKYLAFLAGRATRPDRIGTRGKRPPSIRLAVEPFGLSLPGTVDQLCSASKTAVVAFQGLTSVSTRVKQVIATGVIAGISLPITGTSTDVVKDARVTVARFIRKVYASDTAVAKTSEITGLRYGYKSSTSLSMPFGKRGPSGDPPTPSSDSQSDAFAAISAQVLGAAANPELTAVNLVPELI